MGYGTLLVRSSSVLADFGYWYAWYALGTLQYTLVHLQYTLSIPSVYLSIPQYTKYTPVRSSTVRPQYGTQVSIPIYQKPVTSLVRQFIHLGMW